MASAAPSASPRPDRNGAMLLDRLGPPGFRFTEFRFTDFRAPRFPIVSPLRGRCAWVPKSAAKDAIMTYGFGGAVSFATTRSQRRDAARPARAAWILVLLFSDPAVSFSCLLQG